MTLDIIGNIAIFKFPEKIKKNRKLKEARKLLKENSNIKTVLEKSDKVRGRLRTLKTKFLAGRKTKEALYKENSCKFKLNIEIDGYFHTLKEQIEKDKKRDAWLKLKGWKILRFNDSEIYSYYKKELTKEVKEVIRYALEESEIYSLCR